MTISSTTRIAGPFTGNGVTTTFPFAYKVFSTADVQVIRLTISTGIETTLTIVTDYTITLNGDQDSNPGGNIVLVAALSALYTLTATSDIANLQPTDLTNQGGFYPEVITDALDRATIQIQQLADQTDRAIKIPLSDGVLDMTTPVVSARQGKYLAFDSLGLPIASVGTGNDSALRTDLANASASSAGSRLSGFRQTGTGATARTVDDKLKEIISVKDFGATGNGSTDDTAAIALAIAATPTNGLLIFPSPGTYKTTSTLLIQKNISIEMQGTSLINYVTAANTPAMLFDYPINNVSMELAVNRATRNWSVGADGIVFYDMIDSDVKIRSMNSHRRGLALQGQPATSFVSGGIAYNRFTLGKVWDNKYGVHCEVISASFINTNIFFNGRFTITSGVAAAMTEEAFGIYHKNAGTAVYYSPSIEGGGNASFKFVFTYFDTGSKWNQIVNPYIEKSNLSTVMRVGDTAYYNIIRGHVSSADPTSLDTSVEELVGLVNPGTNIIDWNTQANVSLFRGGLQEIFPITDVYSNTVYVAGDNYIVPGFTFVTRTGASPGVFSMFYNSASNSYLSNNFLSISDSALGKFVDTTIVKNFWMSVDKVSGFGGTGVVFVVKAYDSNNAIITTVGEVRGNVKNLDSQLNFVYNGDYGNSYTVISSVDSKCFFNVSSNVKKIWVGVAPSTGNFMGVSSISLKCNADYPPPLSYPAYSNVNATYIDLDDEIVSTSIPLGGILRDAKVWNIVQASGVSQGWWKTRNFKTITTATTAAAGVIIAATAVTAIVVGDIIGVETIRASDSSTKWHWTTVTVIAGLNLTINNAIPAGYSVAVGADVMTYIMVAMPNNA
jgi:hypothetical protein